MSLGQGVLRMTFTRPAWAVARSYKDTVPVLTVDGVRRPLPNWAPEAVPVPAGPHRLRVAVAQRSGKSREYAPAEAAVTVELGAQVQVEYRAPRVPGAGGKLRVVSAKAFGEPGDDAGPQC
jgi:hypothetical protein